MTRAGWRRRRLVTVAAVCGAVVSGVATVLACGPFLTDLMTVARHEPAYRQPYGRGELGVVKPRFFRRYLVQAYRVFNDRPAMASVITRLENGTTAGWPPREWSDLVVRLQAPLPYEQRSALETTERRLANYQSFPNCLSDAYATAVRTLNARIARYGPGSRDVQEWLRGQLAVFQNCGGGDLMLPAAAPPWADSLLQADRHYQIAAAHFYALRYEEAAGLFRQIADDRTSPWQPYGRYLAARARIRQASVTDDGKARAAELFAAAEMDLKAVRADPGARALHASAEGLLGYVAVRARPLDRLGELSRTLAQAAAPRDRDLGDFQWLMDRVVGNTTQYAYAAIDAREALTREDLTDWIIALQGEGDDAGARALERWRRTRALHWLVAALWRMPPSDEAAPAILDAAAGIGRDSPAFATVAVLRARLMIHRGDRAAARQLLATLPTEQGRGVDAEAINLLRGARLMVADTFEEFVEHAPRAIVTAVNIADPSSAGRISLDRPIFDEDAAYVLNQRFPLDRLVDVALSPRLHARLRVRAGVAAFARAIVLRGPDSALRVAPALRELAPQLGDDLQRYIAASDATDRHRAGILLLLRTPGMHAFVRTLDTDATYVVNEPARRFDLTGYRPGGWWCWIDRPHRSDLTDILYGDRPIADPIFLSAAERRRAGEELAAFRAAGDARAFLAAEAIAWARAVPADPNAAEALARAVEGWRRTCGSSPVESDLPRQAFRTLHRQYPKSEWTRRTPYWYR
jgi:hypothetical protein